MSDMSFKQAKEIAQQLELTEVSLKQLLTKIDDASTNFDQSLQQQESIIKYIPKIDNKITILKMIIALNIGFIIGLISAKYIF